LAWSQSKEAVGSTVRAFNLPHWFRSPLPRDDRDELTAQASGSSGWDALTVAPCSISQASKPARLRPAEAPRPPSPAWDLSPEVRARSAWNRETGRSARGWFRRPQSGASIAKEPNQEADGFTIRPLDFPRLAASCRWRSVSPSKSSLRWPRSDRKTIALGKPNHEARARNAVRGQTRSGPLRPDFCRLTGDQLPDVRSQARSAEASARASAPVEAPSLSVPVDYRFGPDQEQVPSRQSRRKRWTVTQKSLSQAFGERSVAKRAGLPGWGTGLGPRCSR
jgi:hypothetical protein